VPKLSPVDWKTLYRVFKAAGFKKKREEGDHIVMEKEDCARPVIIPKYSEIGVEIIKRNMRTANNMTREEYFRLLGR
jgi:predicted RNA binding protein YcfA (HicA-like mRNA interferase family)